MDTTDWDTTPPNQGGDPWPVSDAHSAAAPMISIEGLWCRYGSHEAVRGINLEVHRGQVFALLGTNGAGKTTTLETLEGHRRATTGTVRVLGVDPHFHRRRLAGRLGILHQEPSTPDELTPAETLTLWKRLNRTVGQPGDAGGDGWLAKVDLLHRRDVRVGLLSGGERRRLDLALALATDPELLLLDEPTTGLDPESRARTWQTIRDVIAKGATVLLTTHYLEEAEALADRLAIMHEGRVAVSGTLADVRSRQPARIRCTLPTEPGPPDLPRLTGTAQLVSGNEAQHLTVATTTLQHDLTVLLGWAERHGVTLGGLHAAEPSLAEVFHTIHTPHDPATREGTDG